MIRNRTAMATAEATYLREPDDDDETCPECDGEGAVTTWPLDDVKQRCSTCHGEGTIPKWQARELRAADEADQHNDWKREERC